MRKTLFALLAGFILFTAAAAPSYALLWDDIGYAYGKIIHHDKANSQITVSDNYSGQNMTFTVSEEHNQILQKDKDVALTFDLASKDIKFLRIIEPKE